MPVGFEHFFFELQHHCLHFTAPGLDFRQCIRRRHHQVHVLGGQAILALFELRENFQRVGFARFFQRLSLLGGTHVILDVACGGDRNS